MMQLLTFKFSTVPAFNFKTRYQRGDWARWWPGSPSPLVLFLDHSRCYVTWSLRWLTCCLGPCANAKSSKNGENRPYTILVYEMQSVLFIKLMTSLTSEKVQMLIRVNFRLAILEFYHAHGNTSCFLL